jgi:hypothetical protein
LLEFNVVKELFLYRSICLKCTIEQVRKRMIENNPMKEPGQRQRMSQNNNNPNVRPIVVEGLTFPTIGAASRHFNTTPYLLKKRVTYHFLTAT